jgi:1-acyl-sn-glycerol-3-phosphate acyltransferase
MDKLPYATPPRSWPPQPRPFFTWLLRRPRLLRQRRVERLVHVTVSGLEHVREAVAQNHGVLITPKHAGHCDAFIMLTAADQLGHHFYYLVGWQVFQLLTPLQRWVLLAHGCFSVDREHNDLRAFRQAVDIVQRSRSPLVVFAEGEIYHNNDWVAPFRPGASAIALAAAQRADRPVVTIPAAIVYRYAEDPMPALLRLMAAVEERLDLEVRPDLPLAERVFRSAEHHVARQEETYLGSVQCGSFPERIETLMEVILGRLEDRFGIAPHGDVPARATQLRHSLIEQGEQLALSDARQAQIRRDFEDIELVIQLFSYRHDYDYERPSLEHLGEILDKFEEDILGKSMASFHAKRRATLLFGEPIPVQRRGGKKQQAQSLTTTLENRVHELVRRLGGSGSTGHVALNGFTSHERTSRAEQGALAP